MARDRSPFPVVRLRGYDIGQVNAFLRAAIAERRRLTAENEALREQVQAKSSELALITERTAALNPATPLSADHAAAILASAQRTAELTIAEARHQAAETLRAAVERAEALAEASERQLARTREDLATTQSQLVGLQALETEYRSRLRAWASGVLIDLDDGLPTTHRSTQSAEDASDFADPMPARPASASALLVDVAYGTATIPTATDTERVIPSVGARTGTVQATVFSTAPVSDSAGASPFSSSPAPQPGRTPQSWFAPPGSPHRPAGV